MHTPCTHAHTLSLTALYRTAAPYCARSARRLAGAPEAAEALYDDLLAMAGLTTPASVTAGSGAGGTGGVTSSPLVPPPSARFGWGATATGGLPAPGPDAARQVGGWAGGGRHG